MPDDQEFSSLDETSWKAQGAADEREIARLLEQSQDGGNGGLKLDDTPFDQTNKADDAEDFEDISDDDLPDEEPSAGASLEIPGLTDDGGTSNDADDLFGDGPSSPTDPILGPPSPAPHVRDADAVDDSQPADTSFNYSSINFDPDPHVNGAANQDPNIPAPAENAEDLIKATWPAYKKGHILIWSELLPPKTATWKEKKPAKKPKQLVTSKLNLDLASDQEKLFRIPGPAASTDKPRHQDASAAGLVFCNGDAADYKENSGQFDIDQDSDSETIAGFSLRDIEMACEDWAARIDAVETEFFARQKAEQELLSRKRQLEEADQDDEWDAEFLMDIANDSQPRPKKRRTIKPGLPEIPKYTAPSFDNFEEATRRGAKRVHLDMSDPYLLLETDVYQQSKRPRLEGKVNGHLGRDVSQRFNLSNDEAYELLKENHQSKVRATLGNISVEHSMPATKLTWPYYKVKLGGTTDEYHRPRFRYKKFAGHAIKFDKPVHQKRKLMKGKAPEVFLSSKDLSMNDNSTAVLFEYCEPRPRVLNNFGMGNKLINYYRRKDNSDDDQLPKQELGEYRMLLPEDRSPFSLFGTVDSGETVPTLHNEMYRAPVFKHTPRGTDFLVVRNTTGVEGSRWYLHKIDHMHAVGQAFPSVDVPGPHSRKVTNASKNRMKMLAFRMIRHSVTDNCQLADITKHIAESTDTQNRQKLKEFLQYDRDSVEKGMWRLKLGELLPDENAIRAMIKPEEVSLLDAMQLGIKELEDAGYDPRNANIDDDMQVPDADADDDDMDEEGSKVAKGAKKPGEKQEETLADKMAPWKTTKAFIDACAQKAMLQLHGEGDPTGHGLGFSFIRTSMKGGYIEAVQGPLATSADAMEREKRANGGHAYNVKKQQAMYEEGIREIWEKQKATLSDAQEHDDKDVAVTEDEDDRFNVQSAATPAHYDDGTSQISGLTSSSRHLKRTIRIIRDVRLADGTTQSRVEVVHDPVVISQYMKRRTEADLEMREYVKVLNRQPNTPKRPPPIWNRLPLPVKALQRWALLSETHLKLRLPRPVLSPGSEMDHVGFEFRTPAYVYLSTASIAPGLRAMPTMTVLQALESKRNSNDWRRTRPDGRLESSKRSCTTKLAQVTLDPPKLITERTRFLPELLESVPIVVRLATLKQIKSMPPYVTPPPRRPFDWWSAPEEAQGQPKPKGKKKRKKRKQASVLERLCKQSDQRARREQRERGVRDRAAAREQKKKARDDGKNKAERERAEREKKGREERDALQSLKRELQEQARRDAGEREERGRQREREKWKWKTKSASASWATGWWR